MFRTLYINNKIFHSVLFVKQDRKKTPDTLSRFSFPILRLNFLKIINIATETRWVEGDSTSFPVGRHDKVRPVEVSGITFATNPYLSKTPRCCLNDTQ